MAKADFDDIYTARDPRRYFRTLSSYDYQIPAHSGAVFGRLALELADGPCPRIVDLCCSYGINATVLKHDLEFDAIVDHYNDPAVEDLDRDELLALDRDWYARNRLPGPTRICGVDCSEAAIAYAVEAGIVDAGYAEDLEVEDPSPGLTEELRDADLITVSGGIGYITAKTIDRVLGAARTPRLAVLCLRWIDFGPIVDAAAARGLVTERLDDATFPQRRFTDETERRHVHAELDRMGIDASGREADGYHHTDLYLLRPEHEVRDRPLQRVLGRRGDSDADVSVFTSSREMR
jgi:hypothetical protein